MIQHHYHRLIHPKEKDLQQHGVDSAPFKSDRGNLCSAQANQTKAEIMHAAQFLDSKRTRPAFTLANSVAGVFLSGVHPKKPAFMFANTVTYTA